MSDVFASWPAAPLSASELQAWLVQSQDLLLLTDPSGHITWTNPRFEQVSGFGAGAKLDALLPDDADTAAAETRSDLHQALAAGACNALELRLRRADGTPLPVRASVVTAGPHQLWTLHDLSATEALAARSAHQAEVLETAQEFGRLGIWQRDVKTGEGRWDRHAFNMWGLPPQDAAPDLETALASVHPDDRAAIMPLASFDRPGRHARRYRVVRPDGSVRWLHSQWEVKTASDGRPSQLIGIMMDDTDAYEMARALNEAGAQLELAIGLGRIAIWRHELKTDRVRLNARSHPVLGIPGGTEGVPVAELHARIHPDDLPRAIEWTQRALQSTTPADLEARYRGRDGDWRYLLTRQVVERNPSGETLALLGVALDITDRVSNARRAEELARRLDAATRAAHIGIWATTVGSSHAVEWNAQMYELFEQVGARPPPQLDEWLSTCVHPDDREQVRAAASNVFEHKATSFEVEFRSPRRDGGNRWIELRGDLDRSTGDARRLYGVALDVTERHAAHDALREASARTAFITGIAGIGTWDAETGQPQRWDAQMFRLRGLEPAAHPPSVEQRLARVHPDDLPQVLIAAQKDSVNGPACAYECRIRLPDGSHRWLAARSAPVQTPSGVATRRVGVNWDITESKNAELARQQQLIAERESQAKSQFMSRMSHELRTPLNAVLGFTQLLQIEAAEAGRSTDLGKLKHIRSAGDHLLQLINDVLDLTDLESGTMHLDLQTVVIADVVAEALRRVEPLARQRQLRLVTGRVEGHAQADPGRLRQVLHQLLNNIIRSTGPGSDVLVSSSVRGGHARLTLRDSGRDLDAAQLAGLFEPFHRADNHRGEGAGVSLTVVKALMQRMAGTIAASSRPGQGTVFELTLPSHAPDPSTDAPQAVPPRRSGRLLYIEDNGVNVLLVEQMVATLPGLSVVSEATGSEGVARARIMQPDLILVDMQLPDFDGFEVLKRLQAEPETAGITCIALSANAMPEDIARGLDAGFADYWTKPIDFKAFVVALERLFPLRNLPD